MNVIEFIKDTLNIPEEMITDDLSYQSISEWSSLNHVTMILNLEEALDISISEEDMIELTTVGKIKEFVERVEKGKSKSNNDKPMQEEAKKELEIHRGLNNVIFDNTSITNMDGYKGILEIRGYSIKDLVKNATFEEVAFLLLNEHKPSSEELKQFSNELKAYRNVPEEVVKLCEVMRDGEATTVLRTAISMLELYDKNNYENKEDYEREAGKRLLAQVPVICAIHYRKKHNLDVIAPDGTLNHAANIYYMFTGKKTTKAQESIINGVLVTHAEHGSNASAFTARVVIGTEADVYGAVSAAVATFSGPLHGGAIEQTMKMLREIGSTEAVHDYITRKINNNEPVMGFGHRVYHTEDPRAEYLRIAVEKLSEELDNKKWLDILTAIVKEMEPYNTHGISINVDYYACVIYHLLGFDDELFIPLFIFGRIAGWIANIMEQQRNNILIRPLMNYVGEKDLSYKR